MQLYMHEVLVKIAPQDAKEEAIYVLHHLPDGMPHITKVNIASVFCTVALLVAPCDHEHVT